MQLNGREGNTFSKKLMNFATAQIDVPNSVPRCRAEKRCSFLSQGAGGGDMCDICIPYDNKYMQAHTHVRAHQFFQAAVNEDSFFEHAFLSPDPAGPHLFRFHADIQSRKGPSRMFKNHPPLNKDRCWAPHMTLPGLSSHSLPCQGHSSYHRPMNSRSDFWMSFLVDTRNSKLSHLLRPGPQGTVLKYLSKTTI